MINTKLRYKGYEFSCNPHTLSIQQTRNIAEFNSPLTPTIVQDLGTKARTIIGDGQLFGEDVINQFEKLHTTFCEKGAGTLYVPGFKPIQAIFCTFEITAKPTPNLLQYSFKFLEVI